MSSMPIIPNNLFNTGTGALGIYSGIQQKNPTGYARALGSLGRTVGNLTGNGALNQYAGGLNNVLGIYSGLQQGGVQGYGGAAANGAQLAGHLFDNPALGQIGGYIAAPLSAYNAVKNWQSGDTGGDALRGLEAGASIGSIVPGVGTIIGGLVGGAAGALSSTFGPGKESASHKVWEQFSNNPQYSGAPGRDLSQQQYEESLLGAWQSNQQSFDSFARNLSSGGKHGGDAEGFKSWIENQLAQGVETGKIDPNMSSQDIYKNYVGPAMNDYWKNSGSKMSLDQWKSGGFTPNSLNSIITDTIDRAMTGQNIGRAGENYMGGGSNYRPVPTLSQAEAAYLSAHPKANPTNGPNSPLIPGGSSGGIPAPGTPGGGGALQALNPSNPSVDYYHYGEGPEHQFFTNNQLPPMGGSQPQGQPAAAPPHQMMIPRPQIPGNMPVMAKGGALAQANFHPEEGHYVGNRTGTSGRADDIDAKLANNEYVMDAETVSLLGDGNPDAGARKLDQMRMRLRQHKGKTLAKGKFSPNAKDPEAYLGGN